MTSSHDLPRTILLWLAVVGAVAPLIFFARFFATEGYAGFVPALFVNGAAGGFTTDLLISSLVFWIFAFAETRRGALSRPLAVRGHQPGDRIVVCVAARPESVAAEPSLGQLVWQSVVTVQRRTEGGEAPGWQGATREHTGSMRPRSNAAKRDAPPFGRLRRCFRGATDPDS